MTSISLPAHSIVSSSLVQVGVNAGTSQPSSSTKRGKKKSDGHIPRPRNAWILYRSAMINTLTPPSPDGRRRTQGEISKELAKMWANATPEVRAFYQGEAAREKAEHTARYPDYKYTPVKKEVKKRVKEQEKKRQERSVRGTRRRETRSSLEPNLRPGRAAFSRRKTDVSMGALEEPWRPSDEAGPTQLQLQSTSRPHLPSRHHIHDVPVHQHAPPISPEGWKPTSFSVARRRGVHQQEASSRPPSTLSSEASFASTNDSSMFQRPDSAHSQSFTDLSLFDDFDLNVGMGHVGPGQGHAAGDLWLSSGAGSLQFPQLRLGQQQVEDWEREQRRARFESSYEPPLPHLGEEMMSYLNFDHTDLERDGAFGGLYGEPQGAFNPPQHAHYQDPFALPEMQYGSRWPAHAS
ncbi:hypothetical protein EVG20_g1735 [Dentipellis fragilis]|uniref:HMG box domain-containing protein n=1 Tax=Dentipellis fragilis TaxID=205917 RepID=A0A4Y9ZBV3_9AGAM|nr:hypothetical protein EVG20_g1735 [Dentipellis fragilis]